MLQIAREGRDMPELRAKSFIKREIAVKDKEDPTFKDPRWIQGCPPELSARVGPYLRRWAKKLRNKLRPKDRADVAAGKQIFYTCGLDAIKVGEAYAFAIATVSGMMADGERLVVLEDDQSRFDLHLTQGAFGFLDRVYRRFLPKKIASALRRSHKSTGTSSLGTKYSVPYTMQSGWPDTSIGDTLANAAMKFQIHGIGARWISIICGDDSVTVTIDTEIAKLGGLAGIERAYAEFGTEIEAKLSYEPMDAEFCSGRFYPVNHSYVLMPKPGRILSKICWDQHVRSKTNRLAWLRGIANTMLEYGKVDPLMFSLGHMLAAQTGNGKVIMKRNEYKYYVTGEIVHPPMCDVYFYYDHHYALSATDVDELAMLVRTSRLGEFMRDPRLAHMASHDM